MNLNKKNIAIDIVISFFSAILLRLAYPPISFVTASIIAFVIILLRIRITYYPFIFGILVGSFFSMMLCSWMFNTILIHFNIGIISSIIFFILIIGFIPSISMGIFALLVSKAKKRFDYLSYIWIASVYTVLEWIRMTFSPEYGWGGLGSAFYLITEAMAFTRFVGGSGISFFIIFVSGVLAGSLNYLVNKHFFKSVINVFTALFIVFVLYYTGSLINYEIAEMNGKKIDIRLIHSGIDNTNRWNTKFDSESLSIYKELSRNSSYKNEDNTRLIIWPETALTFCIQSNKNAISEISEIANENSAWIIVGSPSYSGYGEDRRYFNSAFLFSNEGKIKYRYDKKYPLLFAEKNMGVLNIKKNKGVFYDSGKTSNFIEIEDGIKLGFAICYEIGNSNLIHSAVKQGAQIIVNISNDAWFDNSSESVQQLSILALRCAEFGCFGLRSTSYGISALIDFQGRIIKSSDISEKCTLSATIELFNLKPTFYSMFKDWFVIVCGFFILVIFLFSLRSC
ncbi:MAG: apolipoprotein N-acyltransferase [Desulfobacterales bacterium]|nr:apolipoprotein N-acyltransferase [Desulfobacterales bacterium]